MPNGSQQRLELLGPPFLGCRWTPFRIYRIAPLVLDVAPLVILGNCGEMVRSHSFLYSVWFVVYDAYGPHAFRAGGAVAPESRASCPQAAIRITTRPGRGRQCSRWPSRTRSGGMRTFTGPSSYFTRTKSAVTAVGGGTAQPDLSGGLPEAIRPYVCGVSIMALRKPSAYRSR